MATIQGVYVALFGRPADPAGLAYFNSITNNGADLSKIAALSGQKEYTSRFEGKSNTVIVNSIYQSLFGRDAEAAGLEFFASALQKGTLNINNIAIAILDSAQGTDKTIVTNKLTAADNFTKALDTATEQAAYVGTAAADAGRAFLTGVGSSTSSIPNAAATDAAVANVVAAANAGNTGIVLTSGADEVSLTSATSTLKSTNQNDTITSTQTGTAGADAAVGANGAAGTAATLTIQAADKIDAGLGDADALVIKATGGAGGVGSSGGVFVGGAGGSAAVASVAPTIAGVEKISISAVGGKGGNAGTFLGAANGGAGGDGSVTLALTNATGVKEIWNDSSTKGVAGTNTVGGGTGGVGGAAAVTFTDVAVGTTLGLKGAITDTTTFTFKAADVAGGSDSATLSLNGATATSAATSNVVIAGIETLNVVNSGTSNLAGVRALDAKSIIVTGSGDLKFAIDTGVGGGNADALTKVDASGLNGHVDLILTGLNRTAGTDGVTITGTKAADKITLEAAGLKDTIVYDKADASKYAVAETITNFTVAEDKLDLKSFAFTKTGIATLTNIVDSAEVFGSSSVAFYKDIANNETWVFADSNGDGKLNLTTDFAVKLVGALDLTATEIVLS